MNGPLHLKSRLTLAALARHFFNANDVAEHHALIGKQLPPRESSPHPLTVNDFLKYLAIKWPFPKQPNALRVTQLIDKMATAGLLTLSGRGNMTLAGLHDHYLYIPQPADARRGGFALAPAVGPDLLYNECRPGLVHITGTSDTDDVVAGTGIVVSPRHVLTCRHVVQDMRPHETQTFEGHRYAITEDSIHTHSVVDVAVLLLHGPPLTPLSTAVFRPPIIAEVVYTLGYPKLPGLRDASVTMQHGSVTNAGVTALEGQSLFLYSAISRPGNSGGPVLSDDGYFVGLCSEDATAQYSTDAFSPHYAGVPAPVVVQAVKELDVGVELPFQPLE
ncbi:MAG: serine protease [Gammaproteobacteria bacterium]|nr:serine protease [Gammaproteobacteria bacterium]